MEFGFKETKKGYAKAEVDAYVINIHHLIEELQYKNVLLGRKYKEIEQKANLIRKSAQDAAMKIKEETASTKKLKQDILEAFNGFVMTKKKINGFISSSINKPSDNEISLLEEKLDELEDSFNLDIQYLESLKYHSQ